VDAGALARVVDEDLLAGLVLLAHGHVHVALVARVELAELAVPVGDRAQRRSLLDGHRVLGPQQRQSPRPSAASPGGPTPCRSRPGSGLRAAHQAEQPRLHLHLRHLPRSLPAQPSSRSSLQVLADGPLGHAGGGRYLALGQAALEVQPEDLSNLAHRVPFHFSDGDLLGLRREDRPNPFVDFRPAAPAGCPDGRNARPRYAGMRARVRPECAPRVTPQCAPALPAESLPRCGRNTQARPGNIRW
jgi:hypothetical protein